MSALHDPAQLSEIRHLLGNALILERHPFEEVLEPGLMVESVSSRAKRGVIRLCIATVVLLKVEEPSRQDTEADQQRHGKKPRDATIAIRERMNVRHHVVRHPGYDEGRGVVKITL